MSSHRKTMVVWDPSTGKEIRRLDYPANGTSTSFVPATASFLPDGKTVLVRGTVQPARMMIQLIRNENTFSFVDAATGKECRVFEGHFGALKDIAYSRDGLHVATIADEATSSKIRVWETTTGRLVSQAVDQLRGRTIGRSINPKGIRLAFGPKGNILVVAQGNEIELWDVKAGKLARTFAAQAPNPRALAIAADGTKLASCDQEGNIRIRDLASGNELRRFRIGENDTQSGSPFSQRDVAFSSDLHLVAFADPVSFNKQKLIYIWDLPTGKEWKRFRRSGLGVIRLAFSTDGRTLLENTGGPVMYLWEVATGEQRRAVRIPSSPYSAVYSPNNRYIALGEMNQTRLLGPKASAFDIPIQIYDVAANRFLPTLHGHEGKISCLSFSPDGRVLASGSDDMTGLLWDVASLAGPSSVVPLTANERSACWADLAGTAKVAFSSMWKLVADKETVNFLRENLQPAAAPPCQKEIQRLIADLGSDQVAVRSQAAKELTKIGPPAEEGLRKALIPGLPLETHRRVEEVLRAIASQQLRSVRAIEVLESINTQAARRLLRGACQRTRGRLANAGGQSIAGTDGQSAVS